MLTLPPRIARQAGELVIKIGVQRLLLLPAVFFELPPLLFRLFVMRRLGFGPKLWPFASLHGYVRSNWGRSLKRLRFAP